jgi:hypothetical protein
MLFAGVTLDIATVLIGECLLAEGPACPILIFGSRAVNCTLAIYLKARVPLSPPSFDVRSHMKKVPHIMTVSVDFQYLMKSIGGIRPVPIAVQSTPFNL